MSFIQVFGFNRDDDDPGSAPEPARPVWFGAPEDELGTTVPIDRVIARSEIGVVAVSHAVVYTPGVAFDFVGRARGLSQSEANRLFHEQHMFEEEDLPKSLLRIGFEFADGRRASNLGGWRAHRKLMTPDAEPDTPVLMPHAGGGGNTSGGEVSLRPGYWLWPLPPAGPLRISCEWPIVDIPLTTTEIDGGALVEAARRRIDLFPPHVGT
jgi:hypothetical protein